MIRNRGDCSCVKLNKFTQRVLRLGDHVTLNNNMNSIKDSIKKKNIESDCLERLK